MTVSEFSKSEIVKYYHVNPEKITVVYNAWQHMQRVRPLTPCCLVSTASGRS